MKMNQQKLENLYKERVKDVETIINIESNDDDDLKQEGLIGAYKALKTDPNGTDRFLINKAKWSQVSAWRKGRSVDNGFYKRKKLTVFHYSQLPTADGVFAEAISRNGASPLDEQVINKICLERLFDRLTGLEERFLKYKVLEELSNKRIVKRLRITNAKLKEIMSELRVKINEAFAEEVL
jgi:DNA-directed RNA polymerase specialized sigma24 family protein